MRLFTGLLAFLVLVPALAAAQFSVASTTPANGATGVALNATVSITFSGPADTTRGLFFGQSFFTSLKNVSGGHWSADRTTYSFNASLDVNGVYFVLVFSAYSSTGTNLSEPYGFYLTNAASFPTTLYTVSGTVSSGSTGVSPENAIVGLSANGIGNKGPDLIAGGIVDVSGNFTIQNVPPGTWTPISAKDANGDGEIDPSSGDVIAVGDLVTVTNTNLTGVNIAFQSFPPVTYKAGQDTALVYAAANFPADRILRGVQGEEVDSTAHAKRWSYYYNTATNPKVGRIAVESFQVKVDTDYMNWFSVGTARPISNLGSAAPADSFIAHVEASGGKAFRNSNPAPDSLKFSASVKLGDLYYTEFGMVITDNTKDYWGATYEFRRQFSSDSSMWVRQKLFLGDYATGDLLVVTSVDQPTRNLVPDAMELEQNYPNPFNPTTGIRYQVSGNSFVRLAVYDVMGREVAVLVNGQVAPGTHEVRFDASQLASGVYFYRLTSGSFAETKSMLLIK